VEEVTSLEVAELVYESVEEAVEDVS
jgi:hypothetical protein